MPMCEHRAPALVFNADLRMDWMREMSSSHDPDMPSVVALLVLSAVHALCLQ